MEAIENGHQTQRKQKGGESMNIWKSFERKCKIESQGLSLHFDKGLDCVLKEKYISLAKWLRANYAFPIHINVYILNVEKIQLKNQEFGKGHVIYVK